MLIDIGHGPPLVLVPGIQGRWEYVQPAVEALSRHFRVLTFSLSGERPSGRAFNPSRGLDDDVALILSAIDDNRVDRATICGISFGGLAALRFAASHPGRTDALILVSTPGPAWHLNRRHEAYAHAPFLFGPLFLAETPWRLRAEMAAAFPDWRERRRFALRQLKTLVTAPLSFSRMAARARVISAANVTADCDRVAAPTLILTGEPRLDHVVPVSGTSDYVRLISGARSEVIERTGHLGSITRPDDFARLIVAFCGRRLDSSATPTGKNDHAA